MSDNPEKMASLIASDATWTPDPDERLDVPAVAYMCLTDYHHELGEAPDGCMLYESVEELREKKPCVRQCGIAEVEVRLRRVVQRPDYEAETTSAAPAPAPARPHP